MSYWTPRARLRWAFTALRDPRLKMTDRVVAVFCESYVNPEGQFWVSKATISRQLHISQKTVQRSLKTLGGSGYLLARKRIGRTPIYTIYFPEAETDTGTGQIEPVAQDNVVPLTLKQPETKPAQTLPSPMHSTSNSEMLHGSERAALTSSEDDSERTRKLGKYEIALAMRLGENGYDVLRSLPWPKLMYLLLKASRDTVTENDLSEARAHWLKKIEATRGA